MSVRMLLLGLLLPATSIADDESTTSYRKYTLATDAVSLGALVASGLTEGQGRRDSVVTNTLLATGVASSLLTTPVIHYLRGHRERSLGSFLMRLGMAGAGALLAVTANQDCTDTRNVPSDNMLGDDFLCEYDYAGYGIIGGLAVAMALDAAFLTDERVAAEPGWSPQLTASRDGVRAGVALSW